MVEPQPGWAVLDMVALALVRGLSRVDLYSFLRGEATASDTAGDGPAGLLPVVGDPLEDLLEGLGCPDAAACAAAAREAADDVLREARSSGIEAVPWSDPRYPPALARIFDPPLVVWVRGGVDVLSATAVAIVGSRGASPYGEEAAARLASQLADLGLVIVSGLARGIDAAAHRGALAAAGRTVAVLACGVDVVYPPEHGELMKEVVRSGAVISEWPAGTLPRKEYFPQRNRIISGLSRGVVVVEARQRSGALITADCALEQGREVMAVPGNALSERHRGSHMLLKAGAALVETAQDVLDVLHLAGVTPAGEAGAAGGGLISAMDEGEAYELDTLASMTGEDVALLLPRLLELELKGLVRRLPGGRFGRCGGNVLT